MNNKNLITVPTVPDGNKLWDEIFKAIVSTMPSQLFPLFKEVYGRDYPKGTSIILLCSETSSFQEDSQSPPGSTLMDIALLIAGTDYYHLECQMKNDSEHIYKIPTVKIQTYSLEEIHKKHLNLFIPYTLLRLRPKLKAGVKHPLTEKELTEFVENVILILKEELSDGYLTKREYNDYVRLFRFAANRVLANHPQMREEVDQMTEPLIKLPSMIIDELEAKLADRDAQLANKEAEIRRLQELINRLSPCCPTP